jgi:hypothetical protein
MYKKILFQLLSIFNFFLNIYILFILFFLNKFEIAAEGFVIISFVNIFSYGLSANVRNIYLGRKHNLDIKYILMFRVKTGLLVLVFSSLIVFLIISKENIFFHISLISLTIINWINELFIARNEKYNKTNFYHVYVASLFLIIYPIIILLNFFEHSIYLIYAYILSTLLIYSKKIKTITSLSKNYSRNKKITFNLGITSTLIKTFSNFVWRYSILLALGKSQSVLFFIAFSIGSLFGTLFDVSYGALFLKNLKKNKKLLLNILFIFYTIIIFIFLLFFENFLLLSQSQLKTFYISIILSLIGSYFMVFALDIRQNLFEIKNMQNTYYKVDLFIYLFNGILIPLLILINSKLIISAYMIASIFCFSVYKIASLDNLGNKL